jgi:hypothetical protein
MRLLTQGLEITWATEWFGDFFYVTRGTADQSDIWRVPISSKTFQVAGTPQRLTSGANRELFCAPECRPRVVFASMTISVNFWSLRLDPNQAKLIGQGKQLTRDLGWGGDACFSPDGKRIAFSSHKSGNTDIWFEELDTGRLSPAVTTPGNNVPIKFTAAGTGIIYSTTLNDRTPTAGSSILFQSAMAIIVFRQNA